MLETPQQLGVDEYRRHCFVMDSIPDIVYELDSEGRVLFINEAVTRYGYKPDEIIGRDFLDFVHPDDREGAWRSIRERRTGERRTEDFLVRLFDNRGKTIHFEDLKIRPMSGHFELISEGVYDLDIVAPESFKGSRGILRDVSNYIESEKNRRLADEKFRVYVQNAADPIFILDGSKYVDANENGCKAFGCSLEELVGQTPFVPFSPAVQPDGKRSSEKAVEKIDAALAGESQLFEWRHVKLDGTEFDVEVSLNAIYHDGVTHLMALFRDISARKRREVFLQKSAKRLEKLAESFDEGLVVIERDEVTYINSSARAISGCRNPQDFSRWLERLILPFPESTSGHTTEPAWVSDANGTKRFLQIRCNVCRRDSKGRLSAYVTISDLTREKQAEDNLHDQRLLLESIMSSINEGIVVMDGDGHVMYANKAVQRWNDDNIESYLGKRPWEIDKKFAEIGMDKMICEAQRGASIVRTYDIDVNNTQQFVRLQFTSFSSQLAGENGVLCVATDLTEERRLRDQVYEAQKMEAIGILAGGIAHDMNNILTAIRGNADLIDGSKDHSDTQYSVSEIQTAADRAADLVRQILTYSRKSEGLKSPVSLASILSEASNLLRSTVPPHVDIRTSCTTDRDVVLGDPTRLHQIVMNLSMNSYHAIGDKPGSVDISITDARTREQSVMDKSSGAMIPDGKDYVELRVKDDGSGMDRETLSQIFTPFFTTKEKGRGTGLGLSVVYGIVKDLEGFIEVTSEPGVGTEVIVLVPRCDEPQVDEDSIPRNTPSGKGRIVLVDDEPSLVQLGESLIRRLGYEVYAFSSSQKALSFIEDGDVVPDLLITDELMPNIAGHELIERVRAKMHDLPIVVATGYWEEKPSHDVADGGVRYLLKPYSAKDLTQAIAASLPERV